LEEIGREKREERREKREERRENIPGNGISDGGEDPVELSHNCFAVVELPRDLLDRLRIHLRSSSGVSICPVVLVKQVNCVFCGYSCSCPGVCSIA
jgi:hypothetical protein